MQHHSFYQSFDGPEPIPRVAIMHLDEKIRSHKLVIIHLHELNYRILKGDMVIIQWKVELSRTERHTKASVNLVKEPIDKDSWSTCGMPY
jgi:hypothetical protein